MNIYDHIYGAVAVLCTLGLLLMPTSETIAQQGAAEIEEIVITARKRDESLQEVPESVTVLTEAMINDTGLDNLQGIADLAPNVHLNDSFSKATIRLNVRGIGTPQFGEAPVSFVVDGATVPDVIFMNQGIFDVESIQVLRGPQGALYGQGALAGAIIINSKQPTDELSGNVEVKSASGSDQTLTGALSGPIAQDKVYFRIGAMLNDRGGQIKNVFGDDVDYVDNAYGIRGMLKFTPSDALTVRILAKIADGDYGYGVQYRIPEAELNEESSYEVARSNYVGLERQESIETTLIIDWDLEWGELTSVTNYSDVDNIFWLEQDARPDALQVQIPWNQTDGFSQELRLTSDGDQRFRWIVGAAFRDRSNQYVFGIVDDPGDNSRPDWYVGHPNQRDFAITDSTDIGAFVFGSYDLTDRVELTAALRYDRTKRDQVYDYETPTPIEGTRSVEFSAPQPKLGISFQATDDVLLFASYSRGFRAGGLNNSAYALQPFEYREEISDSIEIGFKSTWFDRRLAVNGSYFDLDIEDYQFTEFATTIGNANVLDTPIKGFELDVRAQATEALSFGLAYGNTDAKMVRFTETPSTRDNNKIPFVPPYTFNANITYERDIAADWAFRSYVGYRKSGPTYHRADNRNRIEAQDYLDARIAVMSEKWTFAVFGTNLADKRNAVHFFSTAEPVVTPNQPRSYGVSVKYAF